MIEYRVSMPHFYVAEHQSVERRSSSSTAWAIAMLGIGIVTLLGAILR